MSEHGNDRRTFLRGTLIGVGALGGTTLAGAARSAEAALTHLADGQSPERRLRELGIRLPPLDAPQSAIVPAVEVGNLLFASGHGPRSEAGPFITGKVGADLTADEGVEAARAAALTLLAAVRGHLGSLDRVVRVVKALGMVNATPDFTQHPRVINGFSNALIEVFGPERGRGARSAVGVASLPNNWAVEVEAIFEITPV